MIDALAYEPQFLDHLAPVWNALPDRGTFYVDPSLIDRAARLGVPTTPRPRPPHVDLKPKPNRGWNPALVASYGDIKEGRRFGFGPFVFLEHGIGQTYDGPRPAMRGHASYSGGMDRDDNELILVPNEHAASRWQRSYPQARVEIIGCPKLDTLPRREPGPGPVIAISFHWPAPLSVSGYAGTAFADFLPALADLAKAYPGRVIGHAHPKGDWPERMRRAYARVGIPFVADFEEVCRRADVYVCDNSSTIYEFAATGRPVVLMNARTWSRKLELGLRFWAASRVGVNVDRAGDLIVSIERALADPADQQEDREEALQLVYQPRTNGASWAATSITDWLASRTAAAA